MIFQRNFHIVICCVGERTTDPSALAVLVQSVSRHIHLHTPTEDGVVSLSGSSICEVILACLVC